MQAAHHARENNRAKEKQVVKKIENIQIKDARGRDIHISEGKPFRLDEVLMIAIEHSKKGLRLANAAKSILAAQSVNGGTIVFENADFEAVKSAFKDCQAFTDILVEQVQIALDNASEAIVEVK